MEIVAGIERFEEVFTKYADSFIVIGGSACRAVLPNGPIQPRRTRDIDMVLVLESIDAEFIGAFWGFIKDGGYKCASRKNEDGSLKYVFYSFVEGEEGYPEKIEILSRQADEIGTPIDYHIEYLETGEDYSHLSAIILDQDYYEYLISNFVITNGIRYASEVSLICLKSLAYLNLIEDKNNGKKVNSDDIKKHRRDVMMAVASLKPYERYEVPQKIMESINKFIQEVSHDAVRQSLRESLKVDENYFSELLNSLRDAFIIKV